MAITEPTDRSIPLVPMTTRHAQGDDRDRYDLDELQPDVVDRRRTLGEHEVEDQQRDQRDVDAVLAEPRRGAL